MEFRQFGGSGLRAPAITFGTATFGGQGDFFKAWGSTDVSEAKRLIALCLDSGVNFFDSANTYSAGASEEILGAALAGRRRDAFLISTKGTFPMGTGPADYGSSRDSILRECEASLRRLGTGHIDVYYMHGFDAMTPIEETLRALDDLVHSGKVRYIGCSNFSGWHLMKSLSVSERYGWSRYVTHQVYYSLAGREYEWELMPLGLDQNVGAHVWSPLAGGSLTGKVRRNQPPPAGSRAGQMDFVVSSTSPELHRIVDALDEVAREIGKTVAQVALNWLLRRPTVSSVVVGARTEEQLKQNLGAVGWKLEALHIAKLDAASEKKPVYPYWHQRQFPQLNPPPVGGPRVG